jgi:hypothetical protein
MKARDGDRGQPRRGHTKSEYQRAAAATTRAAADAARWFPGARLVRPAFCGKVAYPDHTSAQYALTCITLGGEQRDKTPVRTYLCPACGFWHLTSMAAQPST